jgi:hypothetical protein
LKGLLHVLMLSDFERAERIGEFDGDPPYKGREKGIEPSDLQPPTASRLGTGRMASVPGPADQASRHTGFSPIGGVVRAASIGSLGI